ncbi:MAG TPA: transketolase [Tepidiformaceae bacterium]|nr:transketolase [Tepidiformaceae bacterium]
MTNAPAASPVSVDELQAIAKRVRAHIVRMVFAAQSGHPGGSLSAVELGVSLFWNHLRCKPEDPWWPDRDRFILSKGHATPIYYSLLAERGYFGPELLRRFRTLGSPLQGHPSMASVPGIEMSGGSLGQGLSFAIGQSVAGRLDHRDYRCWVLLGDGELNEGQVWEAAMAVPHFGLGDRIIAMVDRNGIQNDGFADTIMKTHPAEMWRGFGWHVIECDGHDMAAVDQALSEAERPHDQPRVVVAYTVKGKGVSFMENNPGFHGKAPTAEQLEMALAEIERGLL